MRPRDYAMIAMGCIAVGVLLRSFWPDGDHHKDEMTPAVPPAPSVMDLPLPEPPKASSLDEARTKSSETALEQPKPVESVGPPAMTLHAVFAAFAAREDRNPLLSGDLKRVLQLASRNALNAGRVEVHSLECRGDRCLLALVDNTSAGRQPSPTKIVPILEELEKTPPQDPGTGEALYPGIQELSTGSTVQPAVLVELSFNARKR